MKVILCRVKRLIQVKPIDSRISLTMVFQHLPLKLGLELCDNKSVSSDRFLLEVSVVNMKLTENTHCIGFNDSQPMENKTG